MWVWKVEIWGQFQREKQSREAASQLDLEEALQASRNASHPYSTHRREWPPLLEVGDTGEFPSVCNTAGGEGTALDFFPKIRRVWASVDNSLFLWRFNKSYSGQGLHLPDVLVEVEKCGSYFDELLAVPEHDDWIYSDGKSTSCITFILEMYKEGGLFDPISSSIQVAEFTFLQIKDAYMLKFF
ncbi:uncharacterized protein LOC106446236 [Brassica napus]|uniref:uncharacterized protein LOC106446236 n=1 Tax=Brassica napus TaxID=3708 RepID=UPI00207910FA|nr:uncharacterized protein LOC106446236 [Brassica napus]